jgi:rhamnosyltransferase
MNQKRVVAIMVAYSPDDRVIVDAIESIRKQVDALIVMDNTPGGSDVFLEKDFLRNKNNVSVVSLGENVGIAAAQNIGIQQALKSGADFILLSDQDTRYPDKYVVEMLEAYHTVAKEKKIAAIAPDFFELNRKEKNGFVVSGGIFSKKIHPDSGCVEAAEAIASGMIVPSDVFKSVGLMDEELFIDWVDLEWCWRARRKGYAIIGCADVVIDHTLGDMARKVGARSYPMRSPLRHYYIVRNAVYLALRSPVVTLGMRINLIAKSIKYIVGFTLLGKPHNKHLGYSLRGVYHGFIGRMGRYQ